MLQITDEGDRAQLRNPTRVRWYEPGQLPDAVRCAGCLIGINNSNSSERPRLALAEGGAWRGLAFLDDTSAGSVQPMPPMAPMPGAVQAPAMLVPQPPASDNVKALAGALLDMHEVVNDLQRKVHALEQQVDFLARAGVSGVQLERAG